ncbi:HNH endonuclease signature motif containing protein [Mycobacterium terramassiliense]|uniref:HNH nuclease n=1 Tax=Mycobacterium terramassiliense TaxID=1841859 RepID=A0A2U3NI65_9MYCO|nr:HNH endonuclease signature motif containing protein [Mycobacterium terramassiliense]SPM31212.1 HNH nuclease [Mycobacterium terramassiliense]
MFELLDGDALRSAGEASVVSAIAEAARAEAAAGARRLAAIAELVRRRADGPVDRAYWSCDNWDAIAAEVAAAQSISHPMASGQMYLAVALRDRLPKVAALFAAGTISLRLASAMLWHTDLIKDPDTLRLVDEALARDATRFGPLSVSKTAQAIEAIVDRHDPGALRRSRAAARARHVTISPADSDAGTAALWGSLYATDAAALDSRLAQMAQQVCEDDPRTLDQRRADALGALAAGSEHLACGCGNAGCGAGVDPRAAAVVVHVVADASALDARPDPHTSGERKSRPITPEMTLAEALAPDPEPHLTGGGTLPASMVAELIRDGAKVQPLQHPADAPAEPGYRPSAQLERFIRCRDMTCRFPGCDRPAEFADIDHTIAYPLGPTHASNLKCLCRKHHLLKTFWPGWRDEQRPDGTIVWTSPIGRKYITRPGSRLLFPTLCLPTGELPSAPSTQPVSAQRGVMMPQRRRTRQQDRARRIDAERALNAGRIAERNQPPPF